MGACATVRFFGLVLKPAFLVGPSDIDLDFESVSFCCLYLFSCLYPLMLQSHIKQSLYKCFYLWLISNIFGNQRYCRGLQHAHVALINLAEPTLCSLKLQGYFKIMLQMLHSTLTGVMRYSYDFYTSYRTHDGLAQTS